MKRNVCIHGHFYQPPRENPWIEEIELQDSASPYHDWNERISAECYDANSSSRILDGEKRIVDIVNNYSNISFNFGPTLLSWMEKKDQVTYQKILEADLQSQKNFSGFGSAIAQVYNHMIMPLADEKDKITQIIWGIKDFEKRFKRKPIGMWLAETAVDTKTLELLAEHDIQFTILAPTQAKSIKALDDKDFKEVNVDSLDTKVAYRVKLKNNKSINLFFYDWNLARDIAFGSLLENGANFAKRLISAFANIEDVQIVNVATDGETFGHHHHFADMALAYCLNKITKDKNVDLINYAKFLNDFPPQFEVEIHENSAWSCAHGVGRWHRDCGCSLSQRSDWNQKWREPLRDSLNWLRDKLFLSYSEKMKTFGVDPIKVRNDYIDLILDRSPETVQKFFMTHFPKELNSEEKSVILNLLEMQRHSLLMFTSCGWFFDDISRIETVQILLYAARAIQLFEELFKISLEKEFVEKLSIAKSNIAEYKDGAFVYETMVKPNILDLARVAIHYAIYSLFTSYNEKVKVHAFDINNLDYDLVAVEHQKLLLGKLIIHSDITLEKKEFRYVVLHFGDHHLTAGICEVENDLVFAQSLLEIKNKFLQKDLLETVELIKKLFPFPHYSFWHLLKDEQRLILNQLLDSTTQGVRDALENIRKHHYSMLDAINERKITLPKMFLSSMEILFMGDILQTLECREINLLHLKKIASEMLKWSLEVDKDLLALKVKAKLEQMLLAVLEIPQNVKDIDKIILFLQILAPFSLQVNFWKSQNLLFLIKEQVYSKMKAPFDEVTKKWIQSFEELAKMLSIKV
ncbi:MAG: DUF3536 domain-containing protein [Chlamydiae bacterium]|nr:DUF3536 domain-containing protein [Chlamydiota bacterium]